MALNEPQVWNLGLGSGPRMMLWASFVANLEELGHEFSMANTSKWSMVHSATYKSVSVFPVLSDAKRTAESCISKHSYVCCLVS